MVRGSVRRWYLGLVWLPGSRQWATFMAVVLGTAASGFMTGSNRRGRVLAMLLALKLLALSERLAMRFNLVLVAAAVGALAGLAYTVFDGNAGADSPCLHRRNTCPRWNSARA